MPGRLAGETVAAAKTIVSPKRTVTAPPACSASFPVSKTRGLPLMTAWALVIGMWCFLLGCRRETYGGSPPQTESPEDLLVALRALSVQIGEEPSPLADHHEQTATARAVVVCGPQMLGEVLDPLGEDGDLDLRRTGVLRIAAVGRDDLAFVGDRC